MGRSDTPRLIVAISGASGIGYGLRALDACRELGVESHLVLSKSAILTLSQETGLGVAEVNLKADIVHRVGDIGAAIASGSYRTLGMIIAPCSVRTMSEIATGVTSGTGHLRFDGRDTSRHQGRAGSSPAGSKGWPGTGTATACPTAPAAASVHSPGSAQGCRERLNVPQWIGSMTPLGWPCCRSRWLCTPCEGFM